MSELTFSGSQLRLIEIASLVFPMKSEIYWTFLHKMLGTKSIYMAMPSVWNHPGSSALKLKVLIRGRTFPP